MIQVKHVHKKYQDGQMVLKDVSFSVLKGQIHGLIGRNGSGKTTLMKCLTGILKEDQGSIKILGEPIYNNTKVKEKIGYVADRNEYFPNYRVYEMIDFYETLYPTFSREYFHELNKIVSVNVRKMIKSLSKGQKMGLAIMLNLAIRPEILFMDEPMDGLDVIVKKQIMDAIIQEVEEREMTVLITSHHLSEIESFCDSVTMIQDGRITGCGDQDDFKDNVKKLQVVMPNGLPEGFESWDGVMHYSNVGSIYTIIWKEFDTQKEELLWEAGAELVEEVPITLEEIFIYENQK